MINKNQPLNAKAGLTPLMMIAKNSIAVMGARVIEIFCALITISITARYLGVELYGLYGYISSIIAILITFSYFGMQRIIIRDIARDKTLVGIYLGDGIILRSILSAGTLGFIYLITLFVNLEPSEVRALYIFGLSEILLSFTSLLTSIFTALERMGYDTLFTALSRVVNLVLIVLVVTLDMGLNSLFGAMLIGNLISLGLISKLTFSRIGWPEFEINPTRWKYILKESFPLLLATFLEKTVFRVDVFVLKFFKTLSEVSLFYGPHLIIMRLQVIPIALSTVLFPSLSRLAEHSTESLVNVYEKAFKVLIIISLPISVIAIALSDDFIVLYFGNEFAKASIVFKILILIINFMFIECMMGFVLLSINKQWFTVLSHSVTLIVNLGLDIILVPSYGIIGASVATVIAYGIRTILSYFFVSYNTRFISLYKTAFKPVLGAFLMGGVLFWGSKIDLLYPSVVVALFVYLITLWLCKSFTLEEIRSLRKDG